MAQSCVHGGSPDATTHLPGDRLVVDGEPHREPWAVATSRRVAAVAFRLRPELTDANRGQEAELTMEELVTAVGSVMLTDRGLLLVPTGPPNADEPYDPLRGPHGDPDSEYALSLSGHDLPSAGQRAAVTGRLSGRAIEVDHWRTEPIATSTWVMGERRHEPGVEPEVAEAILLDVPDQWRIIEIGAARTTSGGHMAHLAVDRVTAEMRDWLGRQPEGAVRLSWFIADTDSREAAETEPAPSASVVDRLPSHVTGARSSNQAPDPSRS